MLVIRYKIRAITIMKHKHTQVQAKKNPQKHFLCGIFIKKEKIINAKEEKMYALPLLSFVSD